MNGSSAQTGRRDVLRLGGGALGAALLSRVPGAAGAPAPRRPNVLYVMGDEHRASALGCYGDPNVHTPTFDAFAREGALLAAAMSCTPVCCPHRASLMTGQYGHHHGLVSNEVEFLPAVACLAETFRDAGYVTGYAGKWHLDSLKPGSGRRGLGFPMDLVSDKKHPLHYPFVPLAETDRSGRDDARLVYEPTLRADQAIRFIETQSRQDRPWLFCLSWIPPHAPYKAPAGYAARYGGRLRLQPNVPAGRPEEFARQSLPGYYGLIESLDAEFGRVLRALGRAGVAEDTIVVYSSDHGDMIGSHGYGAKRWPHDNSARVPFLVRYPRRIPRGRVIAQPFGTPDVYPTLAGLAGVTAPPGLDGLDYSPLLTGRASQAPRDHAFLQMMYGYVPWPGWRALRTEEFTYARTARGPWLLFDVRRDPFETQNRVGEKSARALVDELDRRLAGIMKESGDSWEYRARSGDLQDWLPGGVKQRENDLGVGWPGRAVS
jgi:arylsulfatase A-like enzyme